MLSSVTGTAVAAKDRLMITRLTPNNNQPVDGTQLHEIQVAVSESTSRGVSIANILIDRLSKENPYIKWKVMRIIEHLAETCNETFAYDILKHSDKLREVANYRGPPDPINGMTPYEMLHEQAIKTSDAIMNRVNQGPSRPANAAFQNAVPAETEDGTAAAAGGKPRSNSLFSHKKQMVGLGNNLSSKDIRHDEWMDKVKNLGHAYTPEANYNENNNSSSSVTSSLTLEGNDGKKKSWVEKAKSLVGPTGKPRAQSVIVGEVSLNADTTPGFLTRAKMAIKGRTTSSEKIIGVANTNYKPSQPEWMNRANNLGKPRSMTYDASVSNDFDGMYNTSNAGGYEAPITGISNNAMNNKKAVQRREVQEVSFGEKFKAVSGKAVSDGSYEQSLVDDLVSSGGLKPSPPPGKLQQFCSDCLTLDPNIIGEILLNKLNDENHMVIVKTLSVIEALIKNQSTTDYVVFFMTNIELLEECLGNNKVIVSSKAQRVLQELNKRNEELGGVEYEVVEEVVEEVETPREKVGLESVSELAENEENEVQTPKENDLDDLFNTIPSAPSAGSNSGGGMSLDVDPFGAFSVLTPQQQMMQQQQQQQQQQQMGYGMNVNNNYNMNMNMNMNAANMNKNIPVSSKGMKPPKRGPY